MISHTNGDVMELNNYSYFSQLQDFNGRTQAATNMQKFGAGDAGHRNFRGAHFGKSLHIAALYQFNKMAIIRNCGQIHFANEPKVANIRVGICKTELNEKELSQNYRHGSLGTRNQIIA